MLMDVKTHPENWSKELLNEISVEREKHLDEAFDTRDKTKDFIFDDDYANWVLLQMYYPIIQQLQLTSPCKT